MILLKRTNKDEAWRISRPRMARHLRYLLALLALLTSISPVATAAQAPDLAAPSVVVPEKIAGVRTVEAEQVMAVVAQGRELVRAGTHAVDVERNDPCHSLEFPVIS